jgi:F-type H+-transporting ATPase subunit b
MSELGSLLPFVVNFTVVLVLLAVLARKPLRKFVYQRHERLKDFLESSAKEHELAASRLAAAEASLRGADGEVASIMEREARASAAEAADLVARAKEEAARAAREAEALVLSQASDASEKMKLQFVEMVISTTGDRLRSGLRHDDHSAIFERAQSSIGAGA